MKLLLAEDNPADARLVREMLADAPPGAFEVLQVARLDAAIDRITSDNVEEILLDLGLPDSQGMQTLERAQEANRSLPIVVLTGLNDERFATEVVRAGAQDYLVKGKFDSDLLLRTIRYAAERKHAEEKIRHLAAIVNSSHEGIISEALDGTILSWNVGAERIYGYSADEMIGRPASRLFVKSAPDDLPLLFERIMRGEPVDRYEVVRRRKDGQEINVALSFSPIHDSRGRVIAASIVATDITARKRAEDALVRSHAELRRFNQMAVGRELRMIELKQQVNALTEQLGQQPPYRLDFIPAATAAGAAASSEPAAAAADNSQS